LRFCAVIFNEISAANRYTGELPIRGSTLEFIKTFNAEGKIRFESELSNPYLDITAVYKNYYYPEESSLNSEGDQSGGEVEVA
jgi:hypothetical protein